MLTQRGLVPPAIVTSTIVLIVCAVAWGALGVLSIVPSATLPVAIHRYLCIMLATLTICSSMINLAARIVRAIRATADEDGGYAAGYADGLDARPAAAPVSPAVSRLVRGRH